MDERQKYRVKLALKENDEMHEISVERETKALTTFWHFSLKIFQGTYLGFYEKPMTN